MRFLLTFTAIAALTAASLPALYSQNSSVQPLNGTPGTRPVQAASLRSAALPPFQAYTQTGNTSQNFETRIMLSNIRGDIPIEVTVYLFETDGSPYFDDGLADNGGLRSLGAESNYQENTMLGATAVFELAPLASAKLLATPAIQSEVVSGFITWRPLAPGGNAAALIGSMLGSRNYINGGQATFRTGSSLLINGGMPF